MFKIKVVDIIKTHNLRSIQFSKNCAPYEITWENMVQQDRPHMKL